MNAYKFLSPAGSSFVLNFNTDDEAFTYANELVDGPERVVVLKFIGGDWFNWDSQKECWVYNPDRFRKVSA